MRRPHLQYDAERLEKACQQLGLQLVVLFGSRASGKPPPGPDSDVDLAVLGTTEKKLWSDYQTLAPIFPGYMLDFACLHTADPLFRYEIMRSGILLHGDPDLFYDYRAYAYRDFIDSADLRNLEASLFKKKMAYIAEQLYGPS
ncbi:MAG: nucleotidyltransferase domain-containing protein [Gammaproteobacteria bacterium]|jgi:predicted nucleotidyltransferase